MRLRFAPLAVLLVILAAGCTQPTADQDGQDAKHAQGKAPTFRPVPAPISAVEALAPQVLVSPAGHRMAEFMIAKNPLDADHLILAAHDYDSGTGTLACVTYVTRDGGATWKESAKVPGLDRPHLQFDGWISFDRQGVAHFICLDTAGQTGQTWPYYSNSVDGGMTWSPAVLIPTEVEGGSIDKSAIHAGLDGTVYAAFSDEVARTSDGGKTWIRGVSHGSGSNANGFVEDRNGTVFLLLRGGGDSRVARTYDSGVNWNFTEVGPFMIPPGYNDQNRWVDQRPWTTLPNLIIDPVTDHLYVVSQSWDTATSLYKLHLYRSRDGGVSFENVTVPKFESNSCSPCHVTKPTIAMDEAGRLAILVQLVNDGGHNKEVWISASSDLGETWVPPLNLNKATTPNEWANPNAFTPGQDGPQGFVSGVADEPTDAGSMLVGLALTTAVQELQMRWNGEYWGMESSPAGFVATWIDHSAGGTPQLYTRLIGVE